MTDDTAALIKEGQVSDHYWLVNNPYNASLLIKRLTDRLAALSQAPAPVEPVSAMERDVGDYVYSRIEALMDAKPGTEDGDELQYLTDIVNYVEEHGAASSPSTRAHLKELTRLTEEYGGYDKEFGAQAPAPVVTDAMIARFCRSIELTGSNAPGADLARFWLEAALTEPSHD